MLAFQKIQKQKQIKRYSDLSPRQVKASSIILEGSSHYSYRNRKSFNESVTPKGNGEIQSLTLHQSQDYIQIKKSINRIHHLEDGKIQNAERERSSQNYPKLFLEEEINEINLKKEQKNTAWKDILDLSVNIKGSETSRVQNRITTPQSRITRFHGFQQYSKSSEKQSFQKANFSITNNNLRSIFQQSLSPAEKEANSSLLHSHYHNHQNKDNLIYVRRIQTPNKFHRPQLLSPLKQDDKSPKAQFQNEIIQRTTFILQNKDIDKSTLPHINYDKKSREQRQREVKDKIQSYFIKNQTKLKQENNNFKYNNCSVRGLSMTPIQKQQNLLNYLF